jgi:MerR family transcriptional regulator/heat shock protein HspR
MVKYPLSLYCDHPEPHFELRTAARLSRVAEDFIHRCDREGLIKTRVMLHGKKGLCFADVRKLKLVRHLHGDIGLDLEAVDIVLRYRNRIQEMQRRLDEMEQRLRQKEQEHHIEILALRRRLAQR